MIIKRRERTVVENGKRKKEHLRKLKSEKQTKEKFH
jgi:hypothetical protein